MKLVTLSITLTALMSAGLASTTVQAAAKPDLKVSAIATPGGICSQNKVRVTVVNSQQVGVNSPIPVILTVSQPPNAPSSHVGVLQNGIGPNANSGLPLWFHNIPVQANGGPVTLKAHVNPDLEVVESVYNNNVKVTTVNCTQPSTIPQLAFWKLNLVDYLKRPIRGAVVTISGKRGQTNKHGTIVFKGIKTGSQKMRIARKGCGAMMTEVHVNPKKNTHRVTFDKKCL